jgi:hypothetical protein
VADLVEEEEVIVHMKSELKHKDADACLDDRDD